MCSSKTHKLPHLFLDDGLPMTRGNMQVGFWYNLVNVARDGGTFAQLQVDCLAVNFMDDQGGQKPEWMVVICCVRVWNTSNLSEGYFFVSQTEGDRSGEGAEWRPDDGVGSWGHG